MFFPESEAITCFFCIVMKKMVIFFYPFLARSNCNMLCLLSVDDVCVLFIVYVRICVAAVNLTLQDSLYCCLPEWVHNEKLQTYLNKMICFPTCFVQFLIPLSWNHLLSEQGRRFSKEDEKFTSKKIFFFLVSNVKGFMSWNLLLGLWWRQHVNCLGFCLPVIPVPCYYGRLFLFSIFQCLAVCCAIYGKKYQNLYVFLI